MAAKGAKLVNDGLLTPERVTRGIRTIAYNDEIQTIEIHESKTLLMAFKLRKNLPDFIDCLILSSAIGNCDALATEDSDILALKDNKEFEDLLTAENPHFKIQKLANLISAR